MVLKKILLALVTDPEVLKKIGSFVLGLIILIMMPIGAVQAFFNENVSLDSEDIQQMIIENMSAEDKAKLKEMDDTMKAIETAMKAAGFSGRVKEAQLLYTLALSDRASETGFVDKLVGCFKDGQTDAQLIAAVNAAFGTDIPVDEFTQIMKQIRSTAIDILDYTDPKKKNNLDLVKWAIHAEQSGWGYIWGTYGEVLDKKRYKFKAKQYPEEVGAYAEFIEANWLGRRTADCVGLIKGYGWLNPETLEVEYGTNGMPDINANDMFYNAKEKGPISTIPEIPGLAVWHAGHIGIYIGGGEVVQAADTPIGVIRTKLSANRWTNWLKVPYIDYIDEKEKGDEKDDD